MVLEFGKYAVVLFTNMERRIVVEENHIKGNVNTVFKSDGPFCLFKLICFWCREKLNPNSLIQLSNTLSVQLTETHKIMIYIYICVCVCVYFIEF